MQNKLTHPEPEALTFVRKTISIGPYEVDGFMMPNGEFRQGLRSTGRVISTNHQRVSRIVSNLLAATPEALQGKESHSISSQKAATHQSFGAKPVLVLTGRPERLLSLRFAQAVWNYEARYGEGESQELAWELINALAGVSLERTYQEVFGVNDARNQKERLLEYFIDIDNMKYNKLWDSQTQLHFKRVTGYDLNQPGQHMKPMIANLFWNRLPAEVYETIQDLNPENETGARRYAHHQCLSDDARLNVAIPLMAAIKTLLMQAPAGDLKWVNYQLDKIYPVQRGVRIRRSQKNFELGQQLHLY